MKIRLGTLSSVIAILAHAIMLPLLYWILSREVATARADAFVASATAFANRAVQWVTISEALDEHEQLKQFLDTMTINPNCVYAEIVGGDGRSEVHLDSYRTGFPAVPDRAFAEHGDDIFHVARTFKHRGQGFQLRLGFDEKPVTEATRAVQRRILTTLMAFFAISLSGSLLIAALLARPLQTLRHNADQVASGQPGALLALQSPISEVDELARDLERMRAALIAAGQQVRQHERLEAVGTLAGGIAHEFNNLLLPIMLLSQTVQRALPEGSSSHEDLQTVLDATRRARDLVKQILIFTREVKLAELVPVDLRDTVREVARLIEPLMAPNVSLNIRLPEQCPSVLADRGMASQLLINLCTNALQALGRSGGLLEVSLAVIETPAASVSDGSRGRQLLLNVLDTGHGMDADTARQIFEPFFTTRGVGEGSGLGLSVVHGIVRAFGGSISVESAPDNGTTVRVLLPALDG